MLGLCPAGGAVFVDDATLLCATPRALVTHTVHTDGGSGAALLQQQRIIQLSTAARGVSALTRARDGSLLAVAERCDDGSAIVQLLDGHTLERRVTLALNGGHHGDVVSKC